MVKQFIARHSGRSGRRDPITGAVTAPRLLEPIGRWLPSDEEIAANARARSAVLRLARKHAQPSESDLAADLTANLAALARTSDLGSPPGAGTRR